jgi:hypothetical protein
MEMVGDGRVVCYGFCKKGVKWEEQKTEADQDSNLHAKKAKGKSLLSEVLLPLLD